MRVVKVLNTSIVLAKRNDNKEVIAMGRESDSEADPET